MNKSLAPIHNSIPWQLVWLAILLPSAGAMTLPDPALFARDRLMPAGDYYETTVPDTLDLAERARLAVAGLTNFLSPEDGYAPYLHAEYRTNPATMHGTEGGAKNWGKIAESLIMTRLMSGSDVNLDIQEKMLVGLVEYIDLDRRLPTGASRALLALLALQQQHNRPDYHTLLEQMAQCHQKQAQRSQQGAFYQDNPPTERFGYTWPPFVQGCALRALARWHTFSRDAEALALAKDMVRFMRQEKFWRPEGNPIAVAPVERAHFMGHLHAYTQLFMGMLWVAEVTGDNELMQFVRSGYEYVRNFGLARIGLFGEMCATGDMTFLALKLSDLGVGDYWDDAEGIIRNHLTEMQMSDADKLHRLVATMPPLTDDHEPKPQTTDRVIERNLGTFISDATHPSLTPPQGCIRAICCTGNCTVALYFAWESIVRCQNNHARINLLLNRASPWLDIDSYLPYEGKVVIKNKTARSLAVRLPGWVVLASVTCRTNKDNVPPRWAGRYLLVDGLMPNDTVTVTFPMKETLERHTLKWRRRGGWCEYSRRGGGLWVPPEVPDVYECTFRGNTLIDIAPRTEGDGYPLYQRAHYRSSPAPLKTVRRFVSNGMLDW